MNIFKKIIPDMDKYASNSYSFERAKSLVQIFYYVQIALAVMNMIKLGAADPGRGGFQPLWPVFWTGSIGYTEARLILFTTFLVTSFLGAIFWKFPLGRIVSFIGFWQLHALESSFKGQADFFLYPWLYTSFFFMFLPSLKNQAEHLVKKKFLLIVWGAQALFLLTYTMAGAFKIYTGIIQMVQGQISAFHPYAFPYQIMVQNFVWNRHSYFGDILINNWLISWPMYIGAIYFEFFSFYAAIKTELQRLWGFMMIFLHVGAVLFLGIPFWEHILLLSIIMLYTPFMSDDLVFTDVLKALPLFGPAFKYVFRKYE